VPAFSKLRRVNMKKFSLAVVALLLPLAGCSDEAKSSGPSGASTGASAGASGSGGGDPGAGAGGSSAAMGGAASGGTAGAGGTAQEGIPLDLPLELLGNGSPDEPVIRAAELALQPEKLGAVSRLYVRCHRCGFYDAPEYETLEVPVTAVKASFRVLGASEDDAIPWTDITDQNVTVDRTAVAHGGLYGGHRTVDFWLDLDSATLQRLAAMPALNKIEFRFNGSDGRSNGYRVIDVDLQAADGASQTYRYKRWADPALEKAATHTEEDVSAGAAWWHGTDLLRKSILVSRIVEPACASCHADDGRDLQYFNYSDNSIVQRSRFHGLTEAQGQQIAAYLRESLRDDVVHVAQAAPWNPPYQPGPGLDCFDADCTSNAAWAAGAGLDAILPSASAAARALFGVPDDGSPITQEQIDTVMQTAADMNVREMPVALQFPDWNDWLPDIHPMEVWTGATFDDIPPDPSHEWETSAPYEYYQEVASLLDEYENPDKRRDWSHLTLEQRSDLATRMKFFGHNSWGFLGGGRGQFYNGKGSEVGGRSLERDVDLATAGTTSEGSPFSTEAFMERANVALTRWALTRMWSLGHRYGLESDQTLLNGELTDDVWLTHGEKRGWSWDTFSAFYMAPHVCYQGFRRDGSRINTDDYFTWNEDHHVADFFHSTQWYQLQMTLNSGARRRVSNYPMDWGYQIGYNKKLGKYLDENEFEDVAATHWVRNVQTLIKLAQFVANELSLNDPPPGQPAEDYYTMDYASQNEGVRGRATMIRHLSPAVLLAKRVADVSPYAALDDFDDGLFLRVLNGQIKLFNELYAASQAGDWARCAPYDETLSDASQPYDPNMTHWGVYVSTFCLDRERRTLQEDADGNPMLQDAFITPSRLAIYGLLHATEMGAEPARLATWQDWADRMWPQ
jgi:hypothetical protein